MSSTSSKLTRNATFMHSLRPQFDISLHARTQTNKQTNTHMYMDFPKVLSQVKILHLAGFLNLGLQGFDFGLESFAGARLSANNGTNPQALKQDRSRPTCAPFKLPAELARRRPPRAQCCLSLKLFKITLLGKCLTATAHTTEFLANASARAALSGEQLIRIQITHIALKSSIADSATATP